MEKIPDQSLRNVLKFLEISGILKRTPRTGWVDVGIYEPESVADHTFRTAILCMLYADIEGLDTLKMLRLALIHDLPESMVGDLTPTQKNDQTKQKEENARTPHTKPVACAAKGNILRCLERIPTGNNKRGTSSASA